MRVCMRVDKAYRYIRTYKENRWRDTRINHAQSENEIYIAVAQTNTQKRGTHTRIHDSNITTADRDALPG